MILVVGSIALDDVKTPFGNKKNNLGGSASYFSTAASYLAPVSTIAVVGKDFPKKHLDYLAKKKIDVSGIQISEQKTFRWKGHYEYDLDVAHTDRTFLGAFERFDPVLSLKQKRAKILFLANIDPELQLKVLQQSEKPDIIGLDSINFWINSNKQSILWKIIKKIDILFLNDAEIRQFARESSIINAAQKVQKKGPKIVLVKKGENGVLAVSDNFIFSTSSYPTIKVKDPTGAGDSFAGGVLSYLYSRMFLKKNNLNKDINKNINKEDMLKQAIVWGSSLASFCVEEFSTYGLDKLNKNKILKRCDSIHKITTFTRLKYA